MKCTSPGGDGPCHCAPGCCRRRRRPHHRGRSSSSERVLAAVALRSLGVARFRSLAALGGRRARTPRCGFFLKSSTPATGAQNVASNTTISVTFSEPVTLSKVTPMLTPHVAGKWVRTDTDHPDYELDSPAHPLLTRGAHHPGRLLGSSRDGRRRAPRRRHRLVQRRRRRHAAPAAAPGRAQLPAPGFTPTGPAPTQADLARTRPATSPGAGPTLPTELTSQWTQGTDNEISKAAIEAFETQNGIGVDGIPGPGRLDRADQRHHQRQGRLDAIRLRPREQGAAREPHAVEQRRRRSTSASRSTPAPPAPTRPTAPTPSSSTCATRT